MPPPKPAGGGSFKLSLSAAANKKPGLGFGLKSSALSNPPAKKPRLALGDDVPDDDEGKKQEIEGWDAAEGGAVELGGKKKEEGPRVIPALPNADWRGDAARRLAARTGRSQGAEGEKKVEGEVEEKKIQYGLHHFKKDENANGETVDIAPEPMEIDDGLTDAQRLEKNALDALINGKVDDKTVIPLHPNQTEDEAFVHALRTAPEEPSLEAYQATPIDGFGAALLRGMGWKDGQELNKKPIVKQKEIKRRPALLGIGAKEEAALGFELGGEWGGANKNKGRKPVERYNPVALKNKITGEIVTEDELKQRLEREKMLDDKSEEKSGRDKERRRDREDEYSDRDRDRDRRREKDRRRDRSRARDDERYDSERRRDRKRSDRERERDRDRSDRDRDRSDRDRSDRDRERRDRDRRYRSRSPDSEDRRERKRDKRDRSRDRRRDTSRDRDRDRDDEDRHKRRRRDYDDDERRDRR